MRRRFMNSQSYDFNSYLTIESLEDEFSVSFTYDLKYSINGGIWNRLKGGESTPCVNVGDRISFKGELLSIGGIGVGTFQIDKSCNLLGNCMSILYGEDLMPGVFNSLFKYCTGIKGVSKDFLPATTLASHCYDSMFEGCTGLTTAPELPATTLADYCYYSMFEGCTSLTDAPELPATILEYWCYRYMFNGCTSLIKVPELPATTLADACYCQMFERCSNLNYIKMLATNISASDCLTNWVSGVASTGTFVKHKDMSSLPTGSSGIPVGWSIENDGWENLPICKIRATPSGLTFTCRFENGMSWRDLVNSEYNVYGFYIVQDGYFNTVFAKLPDGSVYDFALHPPGYSAADEYVTPDDKIIANHTYGTQRI